MLKPDCNALGVAGEFRVMSELFLRGHNPAKSYLENGADVILENGIKIEIKTARRRTLHYGKYTPTGYNFALQSGRGGRRQGAINADFVICWAVDDNAFYIIPTAEVRVKSVTICALSAKGRFAQYKDKWQLLEVL